MRVPGVWTGRAWGWIAPVLLAAVVWWPLTRNYFHGDDFLDLYALRNDSPLQYYLRMHGGHLLIVRHAVTAGLDALFGPNPYAFFWVVIVTHLVNTALVYALVARVTGRWPLAVLAAAVWGTNPINEGALGWYAVYGQVLATTCILAILVRFAGVRAGHIARWPALLAAAGLMIVAGMLFGFGMGAPLLMPLAAWLMLPADSGRVRYVVAFAAAIVILAIAYGVVSAMQVPLYGETRAVATRADIEFTPSFIRQDVLMLVALAAFGLSAVPYCAPTAPTAAVDFPTPANLAVMAVLLTVLVAALWAGGATARRPLLAILVIALAAYGVIAVGRSSFYLTFSTSLSQGAAVPRYHYGSGALMTAALAVAIDIVIRRWDWLARWRHPAFVAAATAILVAAFVGRPPIDHFAGDRAETARVLAGVRAAVLAANPGATVVFPNERFASVGAFKLPSQFPGTAGIYAIFHPRQIVFGFPTEALYGRRVAYTTSDPEILRYREEGWRTATLLRPLPPPAPPVIEKSP